MALISQNSITCPQCSYEFETTQALKKQIESQVKDKMKQRLQAEEKRFKEALKQTLEKKQQQFFDEKKQWEAAQRQKEADWQEKLSQEQEKWKKKVVEETKKEVDLELKDLQEQNHKQQLKLDQARQKELDFIKQKRQLEEKQASLELEVQRKIEQERKSWEEQIQKRLTEETRLKMAEKDKQVEQMQKTIEALKRQSEQGSMQIQGDVQENELKNILTRHFPFDVIEDVPTGIRGADLMHTIFSEAGEKIGVLLWESKRTKSWSDSWLKKLKNDQTMTRADVAIIASQVLPQEVQTFSRVQGVWVVKYQVSHILALTGMIRHYLQDLYRVKNSFEGRDERMEQLFNYLSGSQFRSKMENIVQAFESMRQDLESEKRSLLRIWSKREQEITRVIESTSGMYGDLQGLIGGALPTIASLELPDGQEESEK